MAAPLRYLGFYGSHTAQGSEAFIAVTVGKSDAVRQAPLTEKQVLDLIETSAHYLKALHRRRP